MALIVCPLCVREDDVFLLRTLPDGRKEARCDDCDFVFTFGEPVSPAAAPKPAAPRTRSSRPTRVVAPRVEPIQSVQRRFPTARQVADEARDRADALKAEFLAQPWTLDAGTASYWRKFRWVYSTDGLDKASISDLRTFASDTLADTTELDKAWLLIGELEAARRIRATIEHLLRGQGPVEDRLTSLVDGSFGQTMPGVGEQALVKALSVAEPDRFLPITDQVERRVLASAVYGLELPPGDDAAFTPGRLAVWTNDLLVDLAGEGFDDLHHAAAFLVWAYEQ